MRDEAVHRLLGAYHQAELPHVIDPLGAPSEAVLSGHGVRRIVTLIHGNYSEDVQVRSRQDHPTAQQFREVSPDVRQRLLRAQDRLRPACPGAMLRESAVRAFYRPGLGELRAVQVVVPVLIVKPEQVAALSRSLRELDKPIPASSLRTRRENIRISIFLPPVRKYQYRAKNAACRGGLMVFGLKIWTVSSLSTGFHEFDSTKDH